MHNLSSLFQKSSTRKMPTKMPTTDHRPLHKAAIVYSRHCRIPPLQLADIVECRQPTITSCRHCILPTQIADHFSVLNLKKNTVHRCTNAHHHYAPVCEKKKIIIKCGSCAIMCTKAPVPPSLNSRASFLHISREHRSGLRNKLMDFFSPMCSSMFD